MSDIIYTEAYNGYTINVVRDDCPVDPRKEYDHDSTFVSWGKDEWGDTHTDDFYWYEDLITMEDYAIFRTIERIENIIDSIPLDVSKNYMRLPVAGKEKTYHRLFDMKAGLINDYVNSRYVIKSLYFDRRSGLSCFDLNEGWEDVANGFAYISLASLRKEHPSLSDDDLRAIGAKIIDADVKEYSAYICGEVYDALVYQDDELIDSVYGFYGNVDFAVECAKDYI